jgi:hypothetical protein
VTDKSLASYTDRELYAANHEWRHRIAPQGGGLRPHLDPSRDHVRGADHSTVTLVEYGDYQSPACVTAAWELAQLGPHFNGELRFAFRHFPIGDAHPLALHAAQAAEAAGAQGRFWEMHDLVYGRDQGLEPALLRKLAAHLHHRLLRPELRLADRPHTALGSFRRPRTRNGAPCSLAPGRVRRDCSDRRAGRVRNADHATLRK